jgi:hypothetical protein
MKPARCESGVGEDDGTALELLTSISLSLTHVSISLTHLPRCFGVKMCSIVLRGSLGAHRTGHPAWERALHRRGAMEVAQC